MLSPYSQEALGGPLGPGSGPRTVLEEQSIVSTAGVILEAGTGERLKTDSKTVAQIGE